MYCHLMCIYCSVCMLSRNWNGSKVMMSLQDNKVALYSQLLNSKVSNQWWNQSASALHLCYYISNSNKFASLSNELINVTDALILYVE